MQLQNVKKIIKKKKKITTVDWEHSLVFLYWKIQYLDTVNRFLDRILLLEKLAS